MVSDAPWGVSYKNRKQCPITMHAPIAGRFSCNVKPFNAIVAAYIISNGVHNFLNHLNNAGPNSIASLMMAIENLSDMMHHLFQNMLPVNEQSICNTICCIFFENGKSILRIKEMNAADKASDGHIRVFLLSAHFAQPQTNSSLFLLQPALVLW